MENNIQEHIERLTAYEYTLLNTICDHSNIKFVDLVGQKRQRKFVNARKIASYLLKNHGYTHQNIGQIISIIPKDHTSIIYNVRKAQDHYEFEPLFKNIVDSVNNLITKERFTSFTYKK